MIQTLCEQYREEGREKGTGLRDGRIKDERMRDYDVYIFIKKRWKVGFRCFLASKWR